MSSNADDARKILLIGASRGLGAALAGEFAARDWAVVGTVRADPGADLHNLVDRHSDRIVVEKLDITQRDQLTALRQRLEGQVFDILFINAGVANRDPNANLAQVTPEEFSDVMSTNVLGVMQAVESLQDLVRPGGLIGVMSSGQGSIANNANGRNDLYRASKAALNQAMKSYSGRHAGSPRPLVLMAPGWIRTAMGGPSAPYGVEESAPILADVLLAQMGRPGLRFVDRDDQDIPW